jgi:hypothetical protein
MTGAARSWRPPRNAQVVRTIRTGSSGAVVTILRCDDGLIAVKTARAPRASATKQRAARETIAPLFGKQHLPRVLLAGVLDGDDVLVTECSTPRTLADLCVQPLGRLVERRERARLRPRNDHVHEVGCPPDLPTAARRAPRPVGRAGVRCRTTCGSTPNPGPVAATRAAAPADRHRARPRHEPARRRPRVSIRSSRRSGWPAGALRVGLGSSRGPSVPSAG